MYGRAIFISIIMCMACLTFAEFRTWTDQSGNSIEAELVMKMGDKIVIRDRKGRTHKIDPAKLSDEDQAFLNAPPPVKYKLWLFKSSIQVDVGDKIGGGLRTGETEYHYEFMLRVVRQDGKEVGDGLTGQLFIYGENLADHSYVVIDKAEAPVQIVERFGEVCGEVRGEGCTLSQRRGDEGEIIEGTTYKGYLVVLLSSDGEVLEKKWSQVFLDNPEKAMLLSVGDYFNKQLMKLEKGD